MVEGAEDWIGFGTEKRRARIAHRCAECGRVIEPGETYHRSTGLSDRYFCSSKTCAHCMAGPCDWLVEHCHGYPLEGVEEDLREHWDHVHDLPPGGRFEIGRLLVGMRRDWKRKDGSPMPVPVRARASKVAA